MGAKEAEADRIRNAHGHGTRLAYFGMGDPPHTLRTSQVVTVICDIDVALVCDVDGRRTVIPRALLLTGTEVSKPGDHGRVVIPTEVALDLGLIASEQAPQGSGTGSRESDREVTGGTSPTPSRLAIGPR
jgi:hypothetical protein